MTKLTDKQILEKGIGLAPGYRHTWTSKLGVHVETRERLYAVLPSSSATLAALAADLAAMVDEFDYAHLSENRGRTVLTAFNPWTRADSTIAKGPDRSLNKIRVIVESGVLG